MISDVLRFGTPRRITQVMRQLAAEGALDDRFLEAADGGIELLDRQRALATN
jgi:hypothetical protein